MKVSEAIKQRYSIRKYLDKEIPQKIMMKVLKAAQLAPSANNAQPWYFIVVTDKEKMKKIAESGKYAGFADKASAIIVGCSDYITSPKWHMVDVTIAMENMVLQATELGLGTCWIGSFNIDLLRQILRIPNNLTVTAILPIGYPAEEIDRKSKYAHLTSRRKKLEEIVGFNEYGNKGNT
jgi:nitroreductase